MPTMLENLTLEEVSLVDKGASVGAHITLFKRDNSQKDIEKMDAKMKAKVKAYMTANSCSEEEAMKACGADMMKSDETPSEIDTLKADLELAKAENERLSKSLIEAGYVIKSDVIEKKAEVETVEVGGELVVKSDIPAPVLKALEAAEVAKKQHEIEKADIELTKKAGEVLPNFAVDVAKSLLKSFSEDAAIVAALKAADAAFAAAMDEVGKADVNGQFANATEEMDALVKSHMDEHGMKKSDYAKAYAAVAKTDAGKSLITKSYKGE
jgi:hypothetical protein